MLIKIKSCSDMNNWYYSEVGKIFEAEKSESGYGVLVNNTLRRIQLEDAEYFKPKGMMFEADWSATYTASQAEVELSDFTFKGPGWYWSDPNYGDTILVVPIEREAENMWHQKWREDECFEFYIYNMRNPADIFNLIINAPSRRDD